MVGVALFVVGLPLLYLLSFGPVMYGMERWHLAYEPLPSQRLVHTGEGNWFIKGTLSITPTEDVVHRCYAPLRWTMRKAPWLDRLMIPYYAWWVNRGRGMK